MPVASEINRDNTATANPFEEQTSSVSAYTAIEIATLQARLDRQLGPEYISTRPGAGGGKLHYLAADKAINLANSIFGFQGWSSAIQQVQIDFVDENSATGKISLGLSIICRVTLKDGTYHEDIGYGHIENCKGKAAAFEKAKKEAATDALKRALRNFGNVLGNCLYDKDYLAKVSKLKVTPSRFDVDNLHRHPDFAPFRNAPVSAPNVPAHAIARVRSDRSARTNVTNGSSEYGEEDFEEDDVFSGNADAVFLADSNMMDLHDNNRAANRPEMSKPQAGMVQPHSNTIEQPKQQQGRFHVNGSYQQQQSSDVQKTAQAPRAPGQAPPQPQMSTRPPTEAAVRTNASTVNEPAIDRPGGQPVVDGHSKAELGDVPGGRFVAMSALRRGAVEDFDVKKETPSIRRTAGVNSGKSEPIMRAVLNGETPSKPVAAPGPQAVAQPAGTTTRSNFANAAGDTHRRVGMPAAPQSPMGNRGAYKPPSAVKRPAPAEVAGRPPLADTTNVLPEHASHEAKKPRVDGAETPAQAENVPKA